MALREFLHATTAEKSKLSDNLTGKCSGIVPVVEEPPKYKDCAALVKGLEIHVDTKAEFFLLWLEDTAYKRKCQSGK